MDTIDTNVAVEVGPDKEVIRPLDWNAYEEAWLTRPKVYQTDLDKLINHTEPLIGE